MWKYEINSQSPFGTARYDLLQEEETNTDPNRSYENFVNAYKQAAEKCIPLKPKRKLRVPWENQIVSEKREYLKKVAKIKNKHPTNVNKDKYRKARRELEETYCSEQKKYIQQQIDDIQVASDNKKSSLAWQTVNNVCGWKRTTQNKLKATSQEERLQK